MPPLTGVAVNVTGVPVQIVLPGFAVIVTEAAPAEFTVIVMILLVSLAGFGQAALLVMITDTTSPVVSVLLE